MDKKKVEDLQPGDVLWDMHHGLDATQLSIVESCVVSEDSFYKFETGFGVQMIEDAVRRATGNDRWYYTNKMLVVMPEVRYDSRYSVVAAWSYDGRWFGMCRIELAPPGE